MLDADNRGNTAAAFGAADGLGLAAGPAIAGALIVARGTLSLIVFAAFSTAISIAMFISTTSRRKKLTPVVGERSA